LCDILERRGCELEERRGCELEVMIDWEVPDAFTLRRQLSAMRISVPLASALLGAIVGCSGAERVSDDAGVPNNGGPGSAGVGGQAVGAAGATVGGGGGGGAAGGGIEPSDAGAAG